MTAFRSRSILAVAGFALCLGFAPDAVEAQVPQRTPAMEQLIAAAKSEGRVNLAWSEAIFGGSAGAKRMQQLLREAYGVDLDVRFTPSASGPAIRKQVYLEVEAGKPASTNLVFNIDNTVADGFMPVNWREFDPSLPPTVSVYDGRGIVFMSVVAGFVYNTRLVPKDKAPHSLADLLKPEFKGKIAVPPYFGTNSWQIMLPEVLGREKALEWARAMSKQVTGFIRCGEEDRLLSGEFVVFAMDCGDYEARTRQRKGQPIAHVPPAEGARLDRFPFGIPRTAPQPNAAKLVTMLLLSRKGQDFMWESMGTDNHELPGSHMAKEMQSFSHVKLFDMISVIEKHKDTWQAMSKELDTAMASGR